MSKYIWVSGGLSFIYAMTSLGAAAVFFFRKTYPRKAQTLFLGFAAGVMIAASVWSLLMPAIEDANSRGQSAWPPVCAGFALGAAFLLLLDRVMPQTFSAAGEDNSFTEERKRTALLISAITLHNIPEGMAVGLSFALAAQRADAAFYAVAMALALGIGIQDIPEGAAVSLPLLREGVPAGKALRMGGLSGAVEPAAGILTFLAAGIVAPIMPWLLSFAAGAMMYVVVEELIPGLVVRDDSAAPSRQGTRRHGEAALLMMAGFLLMMTLDTALG